MRKTFSLIIIGILAFILFVLANILAAWVGAHTIIDSTSEKQYTLSEKAVQLAQNLPEPITFRFYASEDLSDYDWNMGGYAAKIVGLLNRYQLAAPDKIKLEIYRVKSSSETERQAVKDGILPLNGEEQDYFFGLQVKSKDKQMSIPSFNPARGNLVEADLQRILIAITEKNPTVVGIVSPKLPLWSEGDRNPAPILMSTLKEYYTVAKVNPTEDNISQKIDVLLVVYPTELSSVFAYALDQYVMRGGKVIFVVDPYSELQHRLQGYPPRPDEEMKDYLQKWGIDYHFDYVVGNSHTAEKIKDNEGKRYLYPLWFFGKSEDGKNLHFRTAGELKILNSDAFDYKILATSGKQSGKVNVSAIRYAPKTEAAAAYMQDNQDKIIALSVKGKFNSHYYKNILAGTDSEKNVQPYMPFSLEDTEISVIADSDFLADESWVLSYNEQNPVYGYQPYADNILFLTEQIDRLSGKISSDQKKSSFKMYNIAEVLYQKSALRRQTEREKAENAEAKSSAYLKKLQSRKHNSEDVAFRKILSEAEQQYDTDTRNLQNINRQITDEADRSLWTMLLANLLVYPLLMLLLITVTVLGKRWCFKKKMQKREM